MDTFVEKALGQTALAWQDPFLSELRNPALSESDGEELSQLQLELTAHHKDDDLLDFVLDMHGLSENEQEALSSGLVSTPPLLCQPAMTTHLFYLCSNVQRISWT